MLSFFARVSDAEDVFFNGTFPSLGLPNKDGVHSSSTSFLALNPTIGVKQGSVSGSATQSSTSAFFQPTSSEVFSETSAHSTAFGQNRVHSVVPTNTATIGSGSIAPSSSTALAIQENRTIFFSSTSVIVQTASSGLSFPAATSPPANSFNHDKHTAVIIAGVVGGVVILSCIVAMFLCYNRMRRRSIEQNRDEEKSAPHHPTLPPIHTQAPVVEVSSSLPFEMTPSESQWAPSPANPFRDPSIHRTSTNSSSHLSHSPILPPHFLAGPSYLPSPSLARHSFNTTDEKRRDSSLQSPVRSSHHDSDEPQGISDNDDPPPAYN
ncbi:hypothetical protein C8J56DRAFT_918238 [Mycena floridula]|nr:hypothetical protein C8J56DRAFT_918238 [Mycena floridula]